MFLKKKDKLIKCWNGFTFSSCVSIASQLIFYSIQRFRVVCWILVDKTYNRLEQQRDLLCLHPYNTLELYCAKRKFFQESAFIIASR